MVSSSSSLPVQNVNSNSLSFSPGEHFSSSKKQSFSKENDTLLDKDTIQKALKKAEDVAKAFDRGLRFEFREEAGFYQVEVLDLADNDKVIRKIPPDSVVHFVSHVQEMFGALLDVNA